ncbi:hypothetical protein FHX34_107100 [Actinoplanes teichomyceticus]|uniref:Uncharacterized protein n=1 Tax=Actinoplanes teichomyceticus TaxID=1867 RepID=A0A561VG86_ACTTI|nr:hypothetical protein FHX34_107100 [Actinoplanes teichomyceticus]
MPYTFGRKLLRLAFSDLENTDRDRRISLSINFGQPAAGFPRIDHQRVRLPAAAYGLIIEGFQRSRQVGLGSAVGSPAGAGIPLSGSIRKTVTLCER